MSLRVEYFIVRTCGSNEYVEKDNESNDYQTGAKCLIMRG